MRVIKRKNPNVDEQNQDEYNLFCDRMQALVDEMWDAGWTVSTITHALDDAIDTIYEGGRKK